MNGILDNVSLLPWQVTIITGMAGLTFGLFLLVLVLTIFIRSFQERVQDKLHTIGCFMLGAFLLSFLILVAMAFSFLVDVELGWKLSLLAGSSVVLCATSVIAMIVGSLNGSTRWFVTWAFLFAISFALIFVFLDKSAQKAQEQSKKQAIGYSLSPADGSTF